jgi:predicted 3-demethylubiquinone-9 3-methyltransferase (glyoxalase superfamily)
MEFYHKVLGGDLDLQTVNEQGIAKPAGPGDSITHARLEADGAIIVASDGHPKYPAKVGENLAIAVGGTERERMTRIFNDLAEGRDQDAAGPAALGAPMWAGSRTSSASAGWTASTRRSARGAAPLRRMSRRLKFGLATGARPK